MGGLTQKQKLQAINRGLNKGGSFQFPDIGGWLKKNVGDPLADALTGILADDSYEDEESLADDISVLRATITSIDEKAKEYEDAGLGDWKKIKAGMFDGSFPGLTNEDKELVKQATARGYGFGMRGESPNGSPLTAFGQGPGPSAPVGQNTASTASSSATGNTSGAISPATGGGTAFKQGDPSKVPEEESVPTAFGQVAGDKREFQELSYDGPADNTGDMVHDSTWVKQVQSALVKAGYNLGTYGPNSDGIDGDYGNASRSAVQKFQADNGLDATGTLNEETWKMLQVVTGE